MASPSQTKPFLQHGFLTVALRLQEMASMLSNEDIETRLRKALKAQNDDYWCYLISFFGDENSGEVVYESDGILMRAPYTCSANGATIDTAKAITVLPVTTYVEATESALREAGARNSKADLKQLQAIHDSAVGLGAMCSQKEAAAPSTEGLVKLSEATAFQVDIPLREAFGGSKKIKLIAPGKGSTAFYTEEVLKRDGPAVFKAGTPMRIDHPTAAEEAARPEGSVKDWGAVLESAATWMGEGEGPAGAGLYGSIKPFSDHVTQIEEKGPYAGVSVAAWGEAAKDSAGKVIMREGVPLLAKLTSADGVDMVTRAGAGGMFLSESARTANSNPGGNPTVDAAELKKLQENQTALEQSNQRLLERALRGDAREEAVRLLKGSSLVDAAKERVVEAVLALPIPSKDGVLDAAKLKETVDLLAKREGEYVAALTASGQVRGMGTTGPTPIRETDPEAIKREEAERKALRESAINTYVDLGLSKEAAEAAADRYLSEEAA